MAQFLPAPILADIGELIGAVVTLLALFFWIIQKVADANKAMKRPARQQVVRPQAAAGGPANAPALGGQADPLRNQVEEFLRRANQGQQAVRPGAPPRQPVQPARDIEVLVDDVPLERPRRAVGEPLRPMTPQLSSSPAAGKPVEKRPGRPPQRKRQTAVEQADERIAARAKSMARHASTLGQRIVTEDAQFDVQLKAKFDHTVGTLAGSPVSSTELAQAAPDTPAAQIAAMLASPEGVRQAIVLNEILNRPTDRW
jgi:hypothetical protein